MHRHECSEPRLLHRARKLAVARAKAQRSIGVNQRRMRNSYPIHAMASPQSLIPTNFYDQPKRRRVYWLTPVIVLILYLCVMGAFLGLQHLQHDSVMFVTLEQEMRQQRLLMVVVALSCVIVVSLLFLWRYARIRSRAEAALMAETRFRRAMENSMSTGMRVLDMQGRIAYVNPAFCRLIGWDEADLIGRACVLGVRAEDVIFTPAAADTAPPDGGLPVQLQALMPLNVRTVALLRCGDVEIFSSRAEAAGPPQESAPRAAQNGTITVAAGACLFFDGTGGARL